MRLLIIGNRGGTNIGECFERAAFGAQVEVKLVEAQLAMNAPSWLRRFNWHCRGHRPTLLAEFGTTVLDLATEFKPNLVLASGLAPLDRDCLKALKSGDVLTANYLTDDPWNPAHRATWFLRALPEYRAVFSPRRSNLRDLVAAGCRRATYLPFAYDPAIHFSEGSDDIRTAEDQVIFVGGADEDRAPYCRALLEAGLRLAIYGDYWDRFPLLKRCWRGYADPETARKISGRAQVCLCLPRRANRDGHTMRSFEAAAMGGCVLAEETPEHRAIFGGNGEAVIYFRSIQEMQSRATWLAAQPAERCRLARAARDRITQGAHTYADRLQTILQDLAV